LLASTDDIETLLDFERDIGPNYSAKLKQIVLVDRATKQYLFLQKNYIRENPLTVESGTRTRTTSSSRMQRIYNNFQIFRGSAKKPPSRSPANHNNSLQRIRFPTSEPNVTITQKEEPIRIPRIKQNNFFSRPDSKSQERSSLERENLKNALPPTGKNSFKGKLSILTPNECLGRMTPDKRETIKLTPTHVDRNNKRNGKPPSPKVFPQFDLNGRRVDININNNINVIINNTQISPNNFDASSFIFNPTDGEGSSDDNPNNSRGVLVPRPPSNNSATFKRIIKPKKPPTEARENNRSFSRRIYLREGNDSRENSESRRVDNNNSTLSHNSNTSDILPSNILDSFIDEKRAERSFSTESKVMRSVIPEKGPIRPMRPSSRTQERLSPENKDLTFKFEDKKLVDVSAVFPNQSSILDDSIVNPKIADLNNISVDYPKPAGRSMMIRRVRRIENKF